MALNPHAHVRAFLAALAVAILTALAAPSLAKAAPLSDAPVQPTVCAYHGADLPIASIADQPDDEFAQPFLDPANPRFVTIDRTPLTSARVERLCREHGVRAVGPSCGRGPPATLHI